jgi:hypothetical protein
VAFTHTADGTTRLYLDGVEVARNQVERRKLTGTAGPLMIGAGHSRKVREMGQRFEGAIDELCLYNRALSDEEVAALAAGAQPRLSL